MSEARTVVADPALGFSYQVVLDKDARRTIVFQGHVPLTTTADVLNQHLDLIAKAADRQIAIYELQQAREFLEEHKRTAKTIVEQRAHLDAKSEAEWEANNRKGDWSPEKMSAQDRAARSNLEVSITRYKEGIEKYTGVIARLEPLVNGHADGATDRGSG